jgi:3-oxoacyl-[acyl-carrier protein] reductase
MNVAIVTGSTKGIGLAIARELHNNGWLVCINGRTQESVASAIASIDPEGQNLVGIICDVTDSAMMREKIREVVASHGRIDALVLNAGVMRTAIIGMIDLDSAKADFELNAISMIDLIQQASKYMSRNKSGSIVLLSSVLGRFGSRGNIVYAASKSAVASVAVNAAKELGRFGIRVNAISPGVVETDLISGLGEESIEEVIIRTPLGRIGKPEDVATLVSFLVSDDSLFITGQNIGVDGGYVP